MSVSVIIPSYNDEPYIRHCIGSVVDQNAVTEVIVIDNASTDGTAEAVTEFTSPKVRLVRNSSNIGAARARHQAVQMASTDALVFLDADDFLSPGAVDEGFERLNRDRLDLSIFEMFRTKRDGSNPTHFLSGPSQIIDGVTAFRLTLGTWRIQPMGVMRRELYEKAVSNFHFHGFFADELLTRELFLSSSRIGSNSGIYYYRFVSKPITYEKVLGQTKTNIGVVDLAEEAGLPSRDVAPARAVAARALLGLAYRTRAAREHSAEVRLLIKKMRCKPMSWSQTDLRARIHLFGAALLAPRW